MHLGHDETSTQPALAALGQVIPATLTLRYTRKWDTGTSSAHDDLIKFYYEIRASPETWLIGGQKRTHYSAKVNHPVDSPSFGIQAKPNFRKTKSLPFPSC